VRGKAIRGACATGAALLAICGALSASPARADDPEGFRRESIAWGDAQRSFLLHEPRDAGRERLPLVILLHGAGDNAAAFAAETQMAPAADREHMLLAVPDGTGDTPDRLGWNAQFCCGVAVTRKIDDIGFIGAVIDRVAAERPVDRARIYVTGMSNGAMLAYQIAAAHPQWVAAVAAVAGTIGGTDRNGNPFVIAKPDMPQPVMIIHGRKDSYILFDGGHSALVRFPERTNMAVADALAFWSDVDGCNPVPGATEPVAGVLRRIAYESCRGGSEVVLWEREKGDHEWPREAFPAGDGGTRTASEEILAFFARHSRE